VTRRPRALLADRGSPLINQTQLTQALDFGMDLIPHRLPDCEGSLVSGLTLEDEVKRDPVCNTAGPFIARITTAGGVAIIVRSKRRHR
jgi:hypothetical protein